MTIRQFGRLVRVSTLVQKVRELVQQERQALTHKGIVQLAEVAKYYELSVREISDPTFADGSFLNREITLNRYDRFDERVNFTFFHEVTHYLISANEELLSLIHEAPISTDDLIERLCNVGAAEFLIPSEDVTAYVDEHGFVTPVIPLLCEKFQASAPAVAIQMVTCAQHECYLVVACPKWVAAQNPNGHLFPIEPEPDEYRLCVAFGVASSSARYSIARDTPILKEHLMCMAFSNQARVIGRATIPFKSRARVETDCDVLYFRQYVYAFFNRTPPISPLQLRLL